MVGRLKRPLAGALAVTALPVILHLSAPVASNTLLISGTVRTSQASAVPGTPVDRPPARPAGVPSVLRAGRLVLHDSTFRGVVTVRTGAGAERMLKFTARSLDIGGLDLTAGRRGAATRLRTKPGSTSTVSGEGVVTLYMRKLSGTVTGLGGAPLPADRSVTVTPDALPSWLSHPAVPTRTISFEDVTVSQVVQFGGDMSITGPVLRPVAG
ncbi:hypothetical protein GCM10011579_085620 [Streptomyces albiflavescens]|uniref:Uncharacterized protein n=2 Tax=Streptomyces albiflavescens TaxID=1623582 RepID=A0A918D9B8_9ACTN|nr:hypothetical protein GCM10011579_085620 [Streptomyces albiflavescens]